MCLLQALRARRGGRKNESWAAPRKVPNYCGQVEACLLHSGTARGAQMDADQRWEENPLLLPQKKPHGAHRAKPGCLCSCLEL